MGSYHMLRGFLSDYVFELQIRLLQVVGNKRELQKLDALPKKPATLTSQLECVSRNEAIEKHQIRRSYEKYAWRRIHSNS